MDGQPAWGFCDKCLGLNFQWSSSDEPGDAIHFGQTARDLSNRLVEADEAGSYQLEY